MDMLHELCLIVLHRNLYLAPIKNPRRALDLATGTGIWAIDFGKLFAGFGRRWIQTLIHPLIAADQHPEAEVRNTVASILDGPNAETGCA